MSEYGIKPYSKAVVKLLKGVVENNDTVWSDILTYQTEIQDYISLIGLELSMLISKYFDHYFHFNL